MTLACKVLTAKRKMLIGGLTVMRVKYLVATEKDTVRNKRL